MDWNGLGEEYDRRAEKAGECGHQWSLYWYGECHSDFERPTLHQAMMIRPFWQEVPLELRWLVQEAEDVLRYERFLLAHPGAGLAGIIS